MSDKKQVYILCPRCELNYIKADVDYCDVCKAEMGLIGKNFLIPDNEFETEIGKLCPVCHANYIDDDEEMCFVCQKEKDAKEAHEEHENSWSYEDDAELPMEEEMSEEEMAISLELAAEEEAEEEEEEIEIYKEADDFNYDVDPRDFEDYDEEDDEDDDFDDDEDDE